jgi:sodium/bile acid cotransporter 7
MLGIIAPVTGSALDAALSAQMVMIAGLFLLYGLRIPARDTLDGLKAWRTHLVVLAITFVVFPILGWSLAHTGLVPQIVVPGIILLTLVPTTLQSSVVMTSLAGGDRAFAVVTTSLSSLVGVFATPALVALLLGGSTHVGVGSIVRIIAIVLVPFVGGQLAQRWIHDGVVGRWLTAHEHSMRFYDRGSVLVVVYLGFSSGTEAGVWDKVGVRDLVMVVIACALLFVASWCVCVLLSRPLPRARAVAVWFCGSNKSLAAGLPMAAVLFPASSLALIVVPLMVYHQLQIITGTIIARRLAPA